MFLRSSCRKKDGKEHRYFSIVENKRVADGRVVQRHVLYLGEIDLAVRPIFHQSEQRVEAHIFVSFLAYCLHVTLGQRLRSLAPGLTTRSVLEQFAAMQMIDVHLPTTTARHIILTRTTQPQPELRLLLDKLKLQLPAQPPPKISAAQATSTTAL